MIVQRPLTTGEIAQYCHVTHRAVLKWVDSGKLKAYRTPGNHSRVEVKDFLIFLQLYSMPIPPQLHSYLQNKMKILIVDDDRGIVHAIKRALIIDEDRYELQSAHDGFDAGRAFAEFKPDLVLLDIKMPGLDGFQVCSLIRNDKDNKNIKILAMSGVLDEEGTKKILALGADDYLAKPFDNQALKMKIEDLLRAKMRG